MCRYHLVYCAAHTHTQTGKGLEMGTKIALQRGAGADGQTKGLGSFDLKTKADGSGG